MPMNHHLAARFFTKQLSATSSVSYARATYTAAAAAAAPAYETSILSEGGNFQSRFSYPGYYLGILDTLIVGAMALIGLILGLFIVACVTGLFDEAHAGGGSSKRDKGARPRTFPPRPQAPAARKEIMVGDRDSPAATAAAAARTKFEDWERAERAERRMLLNAGLTRDVEFTVVDGCCESCRDCTCSWQGECLCLSPGCEDNATVIADFESQLLSEIPIDGLGVTEYGTLDNGVEDARVPKKSVRFAVQGGGGGSQ